MEVGEQESMLLPRLQSIIYLFMPRCAAFNWLQLALISVPALDSSYGCAVAALAAAANSPGSGAAAVAAVVALAAAGAG